ncbi:hypothetical protein Taro_018012, partial [Colocasia esculenta]|nr:hypothetical protein [Colocasia esculenta]
GSQDPTGYKGSKKSEFPSRFPFPSPPTSPARRERRAPFPTSPPSPFYDSFPLGWRRSRPGLHPPGALLSHRSEALRTHPLVRSLKFQSAGDVAAKPCAHEQHVKLLSSQTLRAHRGGGRRTAPSALRPEDRPRVVHPYQQLDLPRQIHHKPGEDPLIAGEGVLGIGVYPRRHSLLLSATAPAPCPSPSTFMFNDKKNLKEGGPSSSCKNSSATECETGWLDTLKSLAQRASVYGVAAGYCISASLLSIINKWAVMKFPYPGALTALQYFTSALGVLLCGWLKLVEHDRLDLRTMWRFLPAAIIFYLSLFTNSELLLHANVDTFIVFRSVVPLFVAVGETLFLNQPWPSLHTWLSLATIFGGSVIYVMTDYQFTVTAYTWALAYLVSMSIDFVYIKHVVMTIGLNTWGLVLYNNLEALMLFPLELLVMGELKKIKHEISDESDWYSLGVTLPVGLSCLFGLAISFFGFSCRRAISATGFTVLGIVNKLLTVVINLIIWDKHSTIVGTIGLLICMLGGVLYQQSTTKPKAMGKEVVAKTGDDEEQRLLEMENVPKGNNAEKLVSVSEDGT